jgi:thioredoxin 1
VAIAEVTQKEFQQEVLAGEAPVLVAFRAGWCAPSVQLEPIIEDVASTYKGKLKVVSVHVGADKSELRANELARKYNVTRVPVVMVFKDGQVKDFIGGATSKADIGEMVERQLRPVLDVTVHDFDSEVLKSDVPVLVHFYARWCAASREIAPLVEEAAEQFRGRAKVARLEFGPETAALCERYGIRRVPVLALFEGGEIKDQILGAMKGGTKSAARRTSCVGLTSTDNIAEMVQQFLR